MSKREPVMAAEGHHEGDQPADQVGRQRRCAKRFDAAHGNGPMRCGGSAADGDEKTDLPDEGAHGECVEELNGETLMSKRVVVCGDDFGMNAEVDEGMIALAGMRRVSAVSCLSLGPTFAANAPRLAAQDVDIGLHLNFSETLGANAEPLPSLGALILALSVTVIEVGLIVSLMTNDTPDSALVARDARTAR